jgi:hypothetical protein
MARDVADFRDLQAPPPTAEEGQLVVVSIVDPENWTTQ